MEIDATIMTLLPCPRGWESIKISWWNILLGNAPEASPSFGHRFWISLPQNFFDPLHFLQWNSWRDQTPVRPLNFAQSSLHTAHDNSNINLPPPVPSTSTIFAFHDTNQDSTAQPHLILTPAANYQAQLFSIKLILLDELVSALHPSPPIWGAIKTISIKSNKLVFLQRSR